MSAGNCLKTEDLKKSEIFLLLAFPLIISLSSKSFIEIALNHYYIKTSVFLYFFETFLASNK